MTLRQGMPDCIRLALQLFMSALLLGAIASGAFAQDEHAAQTVWFRSVGGEEIELVGHLRRPDVAGPFPAVILLHGCAGDWRGMASRWGTRLVEWGYVALSVDSYGPRGIKTACGSFSAVDPSDHMYDAYGALSFLAAQPFVVPGRAAVMGVSGGATMALMAAELNSERGCCYQFRTAVVLYPDCRVINGPMTIPTLILIGQSDTLTPARFS